jgi:phage terminase large subunit-like protein
MNEEVNFDELAKEYMLREKARSSLLAFTQFTFPNYVADPLHIAIANALDLVAEGKIDRLIISIPPQHGKSELCSVRFPAYWLGKNPDMPVILTSYSADLASDKSQQVRDLVNSDKYRKIFPEIQLNRASQAKDYWKLDKFRGYLLSGGVDGPLTGFGAKLGIIDDPYKNWEEAQSETNRRKVSNWYKTVFRTRIWEGGRIVFPMTRWHVDDLAGEFIRTGEWYVLRIPAIAESQKVRDAINDKMGLPLNLPDPLLREEGESASPKRYSKQALESLQSDLTELMFQALYQGFPTLATGNKVKEEHFMWIDDIPKDIISRCTLIRYWDKAGTEDGGKYSAGVLMMYDPKEDYYYIPDYEIRHFRYSANKRELAIRETAQSDYDRYNGAVRTFVEQEPGSGGKESAENTLYNLSDFMIEVDKVRADKDTRFEPFAGKIQQKRVRFTRGKNCEWLRDEALSIPNGIYRDMTDAAAGCYAKIRQLVKKQPTFTAPIIHQMLGSSNDSSLLMREMNIIR